MPALEIRYSPHYTCMGKSLCRVFSDAIYNFSTTRRPSCSSTASRQHSPTLERDKTLGLGIGAVRRYTVLFHVRSQCVGSFQCYWFNDEAATCTSAAYDWRVPEARVVAGIGFRTTKISCSEYSLFKQNDPRTPASI